MSYYGTDLETADPSFDDPTAELEVQAEADDPDGDLGDGLARRKRAIETGDLDLIRTRAKRLAGG